ncbi:uncharacterized protein LOC110869769 [Helianthus annuus]|uniref:uncharacterized protein LOC110869769 n=1 Tax=Helianthus annuus TaxID=4232 RepID=UPI000B8EFD2B|nr:uncharacterized protein LOC110869769 [Helianthus annuus]
MEGRYPIQKKGKLSPRFIGPFRIIERVGKVAYRLELPEELSGIHGTFHVSQLRKCLAEETAYIHYDDIGVDNSLNYVIRPIEILDRKVKDLRNKRIDQMKIKWDHRKGSDTTWESEEEMRRLYPTLFGTYCGFDIIVKDIHQRRSNEVSVNKFLVDFDSVNDSVITHP